MEDTPDLLWLLGSEEFSDFVTVSVGTDDSLDAYNPASVDNYYTLMQRQERHVKRSLAECRQREIEWLSTLTTTSYFISKSPSRGLSTRLLLELLVSFSSTLKQFQRSYMRTVSLRYAAAMETRHHYRGQSRAACLIIPNLRSNRYILAPFSVQSSRAQAFSHGRASTYNSDKMNSCSCHAFLPHPAGISTCYSLKQKECSKTLYGALMLECPCSCVPVCAFVHAND